MMDTLCFLNAAQKVTGVCVVCPLVQQLMSHACSHSSLQPAASRLPNQKQRIKQPVTCEEERKKHAGSIRSNPWDASSSTRSSPRATGEPQL
jgi:hypothetical protein